jgi:hypothetical protein
VKGDSEACSKSSGDLFSVAEKNFGMMEISYKKAAEGAAFL